MEVDDAADFIHSLPPELQDNVLAAINEDDRTQVEDLLAYPEDSAGGLMHLDVLRMSEDATCREAIIHLQSSENVEMAFYLYVLTDSNQLVGVLSLRSLLTNPPSTPLKEIMVTNLITVPPTEDQTEVARLVRRYDLLAIPVTDDNRELLGIITVDDVIDVIQVEADQKMMLMAGMNEEHNPNERNVFRAFKQRLTWLTITLFGGRMAELIGVFEGALENKAALAGFIPVMLGTGGNVGTQAATIAVRNLAIDSCCHVTTGDVVERSSSGLIAWPGFRHYPWKLCAAERRSDDGLGNLRVDHHNRGTAALLGMLVPLSLDRLSIDPAVATGPFVTTGIDLAAILIYFTTCQALLPI